MPRKSRPLDRAAGEFRDASIIVVACEDMHAVKQYFAKFRAKRVQYKILPTEDNNSSPQAVLERLDDYRNEYAQEDGDELWICIDADHWIREKHQRNLSRVLQECRQKGYGIAVSNPCFEVWLLLHFTEIDDSLLSKLLGKDPSEEVSSRDIDSIRCSQIESELRLFAGGYCKTNVHRLDLSVSQVELAVQRAKNSDRVTGDVPQCQGTRAYKLLDKLQERDSIDLSQ